MIQRRTVARVAILAFLLVDACAFGRKACAGRWRRRGLMLNPRGELRFGFCDNLEPHPGVLHSTKFGTGALICAGRISFEPNIGGTPWYGIHFASQLRDPEIVDYVGGLDFRKQPAAH